MQIQKVTCVDLYIHSKAVQVDSFSLLLFSAHHAVASSSVVKASSLRMTSHRSSAGGRPFLFFQNLVSSKVSVTLFIPANMSLFGEIHRFV